MVRREIESNKLQDDGEIFRSEWICDAIELSWAGRILVWGERCHKSSTAWDVVTFWPDIYVLIATKPLRGAKNPSSIGDYKVANTMFLLFQVLWWLMWCFIEKFCSSNFNLLWLCTFTLITDVFERSAAWSTVLDHPHPRLSANLTQAARFCSLTAQKITKRPSRPLGERLGITWICWLRNSLTIFLFFFIFSSLFILLTLCMTPLTLFIYSHNHNV